MHMVFALLCFVAVIHWLIYPYPSGLLHWHCGNLTIAPVPAKQPWWIWMHTPCEFIMNDCITTTKQSTTKPCAYFLGYTVQSSSPCNRRNIRFGVKGGKVFKVFYLSWINVYLQREKNCINTYVCYTLCPSVEVNMLCDENKPEEFSIDDKTATV